MINKLIKLSAFIISALGIGSMLRVDDNISFIIRGMFVIALLLLVFFLLTSKRFINFLKTVKNLFF